MYFTPQLKVRLFENQATEVFIRGGDLNKMTQLAMPNADVI